MSPKHWITCGAIVGGLGVAIGTFGAHLLPGVLQKASYTVDETAEAVDLFRTAIRYQMFHAPMIVLIGVLLGQGRSRGLQVAGWAFLAGVLLFSGFLYAWVLTLRAWPWMVHIVPVGGTLLIIGWFTLAGTFCCCKADAPE